MSSRRRTPMRSGALALVLGLIAALTPGIAGLVAASAVEPEHVSFTFEGCRGSVGLSFPALGPFICDDDEYTSGNLGKGWNELDRVPHRLTTEVGEQTSATTDYTVNIVADHEEAGHPGYDIISEPEVNVSKSDASCTVSSSAQGTEIPGIGGTDESIFRTLTIHQAKGTTCVFDWNERLALGSHLYPGASLHSNLTQEDFSTGGVGARDISIPVNEILPQELRKDMIATRNADHVWNITKGATPASVDFEDTCTNNGAPQSAQVSIRVQWDRLPATPSGDVTIVTNVYAKNPAHRPIIVDVTDKVYEGTDQTTLLDTASSGPVTVPANTELLVLTHTFTSASSANQFNDVATATYTDPIPGQTTATASATVQTGTTTNATATITDVESISGAGLSFSVDSSSGASGSFGGGYAAGTATTGPVSWTSATQSDDGFVEFQKTIYVTGATQTSGTLSDTATLTGSDGFSASANASVAISADAEVSLTINKSIPLVLDNDDAAQTFTFNVTGPGGFSATPAITFNPGEGASPKSVTLSGLAPGSYTVSEVDDPNDAWAAQPAQTVAINLPTCSQAVTFQNAFDQALAQVRKVTLPAGEEAGWTFRLNGPGGGEEVTTTGTGFVGFTTQLQEGAYTITEVGGPAGWDQTGSTGCSFTVDYPADAGRVFECTFKNTQRGSARVIKTVNGQPPSGDQAFTFQLRQGASPTQAGTTLETKVANAANGGQFAFDTLLVPGQTYQICEIVMPGWTSTLGNFVPASFIPPDGIALDPNVDNSIVCADFTVAPGETKTFTIDNSPPPGGRALTIGFWRNWSGDCTGGNQADVLGQVLASFSGGGTWIGDLFVDLACDEAVPLLSKRDIDSGKNMANDAAYELAAQLLAAKLNVQAGAGTCGQALTAIIAGQALLEEINFDGTGSFLGPKVKGQLATLRNQALQYAHTLDLYNNNMLCS